MRNSLVFFKDAQNDSKFKYKNWDCCESLGQSFKDHNKSNEMFVAIPLIEMDEFFLINNRINLGAYLEFITNTFDIDYSVASESEIENIDLANSGFSDKSQMAFIKISTKKDKSNKYFNVAYNTMRYLWYQQYTNMAVIATNLYNLHFIEDTMDILAIAFSYQTTKDRAVLPAPTNTLPGILFFRPKKDIIKELQQNTAFNTVFYKYPIYFDPEVKIKGSFFDDIETTIKAKEIFSKLVGIWDINDIPKLMIRNFRLVYEDYKLMKESYMVIKKHLDDKKYAMNFSQSVLLSKNTSEVSINVVTPSGMHETVKIMIYPNKAEPVLFDDPIEFKKIWIEDVLGKADVRAVEDADFEEEEDPEPRVRRVAERDDSDGASAYDPW